MFSKKSPALPTEVKKRLILTHLSSPLPTEPPHRVYQHSTNTLWHESSSASNRKPLGSVAMAAEINGVSLPPVGSLAQQRHLSRAKRITKDSSHPCHRLVSLLPLSKSYHRLACRTVRLCDSYDRTSDFCLFFCDPNFVQQCICELNDSEEI